MIVLHLQTTFYLTSLALLLDQKADFSNFNSREISQKEDLAGKPCPSQDEEQDPLWSPRHSAAFPWFPHTSLGWRPVLTSTGTIPV